MGLEWLYRVCREPAAGAVYWFTRLYLEGLDEQRGGRKRVNEEETEWVWLKGKRSLLRREIIDYVGVFIGVNLTALGLAWFLIPYKLPLVGSVAWPRSSITCGVAGGVGYSFG